MTSTTTAPSLVALAFGDVAPEFANTRKVLERVVDEDLDFRPHEKSWTLSDLATHVATLPWWGTHICTNDEIDLAGFPKQEPARSGSELLAKFDATAAEFTAALAALPDEALGHTYTARVGDHVIAAMPKAATLRGFMVNHLVHHRAQLTIYLRLRNRAIPGLYGPSADES